jgi:choline dehydrogenase-like flavoprotein
MLLLNTKLAESNTYDVIVVGSGMSGGWAAKELCEKGFKTLVLDRGKMMNHLVDYKYANTEDWEMEYRGDLSKKEKEEHHIQYRGYHTNGYTKDSFMKDSENPYEEVNRFDWIRADIVGGRSLLWGRQVYRWSDIDFTANAREGVAVDWPIRYADIAPWYSYVEKYAGVSGEKLSLPHLPDGEFLPPMDLNMLEKHFRSEVQKNWKERNVTIGRVAHITEAQPHHLATGRGKCQKRNKCALGCPYGAYFSSLGVTLPAANVTGNLSIRPNSIVHSIIYDDKTQKAKGVRVIDKETLKETEFYSKIVFLCASSVESTKILMNSTSERFPNGLGNDSDELGRNIMDHHYRVGAVGEYEGMLDHMHEGNRPNGLFIPRYVNNDAKTKKPFMRGWDYQGGADRAGWGSGADGGGVGASFKDSLKTPGKWTMRLMGFGETLPHRDNRFTFSKDKKDKWGIPLVVFDAKLRDNELAMRKQMRSDAGEMLERAGFKDIITFDENGILGIAIHEMGTARMGLDPKTSVLNKHNQVHAVKNVFVTDGACMTSSNCVNPSITYMALTARAADYAAQEMKKGNL